MPISKAESRRMQYESELKLGALSWLDEALYKLRAVTGSDDTRELIGHDLILQLESGYAQIQAVKESLESKWG